MSKKATYATIAIAAALMGAAAIAGMGSLDRNTRIAKSLGSICTAAASCGDLLYVSCRPEVDGPTYYVDIPSEKVISTCGGACWHRAANSDCATKCPPPQWTCDGGGN